MERRLSKLTLIHALAYKANSGELFGEALDEVIRLTADGYDVYPPSRYPTWQNPVDASGLQRRPSFVELGRLTPAEAVGVKVLQMETIALMQYYGINSRTSLLLNDVLKIVNDGWQLDVIEGMVDFNIRIRVAAEARAIMIGDLSLPSGRTIGDKIKKSGLNMFSRVISLDQMRIGSNTAGLIENLVASGAQMSIPDNRVGAKTSEEIQARIASWQHGGKLANQLYLESVSLAARIVPDSLEVRT